MELLNISMNKSPLKITDQEIEILLKSGKTNFEIAELLGRTHTTISRWRKKFGIVAKKGSPKGPRRKSGKEIKCKVCPKMVYVVPSWTPKYCSRKCQFSDPDHIHMLKTMDRSYMNTYAYRITKTKSDTPEYTRYKNRVHKLSEQTYHQYKEKLNPENRSRTLCGVSGGYQLDHIKTVRECFDSGITPEMASVVENLRLLPWKDNVGRNKRAGF